MPQGVCRGYGTIRPATPTDCRYAESIHRICHRPAAAATEPPKRIFRVWGRHGGPILVLRATHSATGCVPWVRNDQTGDTNRLPIRRVDSPYMSSACCQSLRNAFFGSGPPWRSHSCIEGYPQCHRVCAVGMERSDRQHQPIADTQSRFTVYVTGLLPEPPKRIFRVWGRHAGHVTSEGLTPLGHELHHRQRLRVVSPHPLGHDCPTHTELHDVSPGVCPPPPRPGASVSNTLATL